MRRLRRLYFKCNCFVDPALLADMLEDAPGLEVVALHWDARAFVLLGDRTVADAWDALARRRDSLREIRLDVLKSTSLGWGDGGWDSLVGFERLEVLKVDGHALGALRAVWERRNRHTGWIASCRACFRRAFVR
ncbi:uncharacterized protein THITE_2114196 [Thermothielavioides terrestris NRRL 8126]|uniref:Uncharacterized protein n=1 Tax=Thermothielavioides terrestris (strain ATCC 38088 / NRRL 8126) TaxID=578455 RepID=G2QYD3_THETT|nr:uncharacterized protein THITE_2114196 [Thermothielavioides terrestris NRRL 8126]AEO66231.1 hypothetical protein THITE_2114196 [Thermothielavioides terrestris NRRL 8126]